MGNRAVIAMTETGAYEPNSRAMYLHWNGGVGKVSAFLEVAKLFRAEFDTPDDVSDMDWNWELLRRVVYMFYEDDFGAEWKLWSDSGTPATLDSDNGDNGLYCIDKDLNVVERKFVSGFACPATSFDIDNPEKIKTSSHKELLELNDFIRCTCAILQALAITKTFTIENRK